MIQKESNRRIKQVLTNLIKNAMIAVEPKKGKIEVSMKETPSDIQISIQDNGMGIPKDKQKDLFKKFYQVDTTLTRERGGSGLGLAICRGIINNHGGEITVQSEEGKGARFTFNIPKQAIALA
jgi:signal transduction histidine kinase